MLLTFILHFAACGCVLSPYRFYTWLQHHLHNFHMVLKIETSFRQRSCSGDDWARGGMVLMKRARMDRKSRGTHVVLVVQKWKQGRGPQRGVCNWISQSSRIIFGVQREQRKRGWWNRPTACVKSSREKMGSGQDECTKVTVNGDVLLFQLCRLWKGFCVVVVQYLP